jgi:hypothetical protein
MEHRTPDPIASGLILAPSAEGGFKRMLARLWDKRRRLHRVPPVLSELARAAIADPREARHAGDRIRRRWAGRQSASSGKRVAIYAHYAPTGHVHEMTLRQLALYGANGFDVVFVTMCERLASTDLRGLLPLTRFVLHRRSFGRDFGAWQDATRLLAAEIPPPLELLLANDSVLGPARPIDNLIRRMRDHGPGLVGLTDSRMGPPHLQSYFLLAVGHAAVVDVFSFLERLRLSHSRWLMVRRGEYGLTRFMAARGHPVVSMFNYDIVRAAAMSLGGMPGCAPMNPTHHWWRVLIEVFDFPFIKRDLITENPNSVPDVDQWPAVLPSDSVVDAATIRSYLAEMGWHDRQGPSHAP